jgi:hypothetical protein
MATTLNSPANRHPKSLVLAVAEDEGKRAVLGQKVEGHAGGYGDVAGDVGGWGGVGEHFGIGGYYIRGYWQREGMDLEMVSNKLIFFCGKYYYGFGWRT